MTAGLVYAKNSLKVNIVIAQTIFGHISPGIYEFYGSMNFVIATLGTQRLNYIQYRHSSGNELVISVRGPWDPRCFKDGQISAQISPASKAFPVLFLTRSYFEIIVFRMAKFHSEVQFIVPHKGQASVEVRIRTHSRPSKIDQNLKPSKVCLFFTIK